MQNVISKSSLYHKLTEVSELLHTHADNSDVVGYAKLTLYVA